ncbi:hypothetical protein [Paenibacillus pabuli]|uniref:hypothetical protein n=1 Tax=Paenibacillus pabuli TaxID=1472 RepID=UPI001FFE9A88|nr:hypothetical protein [Paenibacillus pabuli]UPK42749.1 hypothetical protein KET34_26840 [Paenibacillus pabuli]
MTALTKETTDELLEAMDTYKRIAQELINKLISETSQTEKEKIIDGAYFLKSTANLEHLISYFENPFGDMLDFFERLAAQNVLIHVRGVEYRKLL